MYRIRGLPWWYQLATAIACVLTLLFLVITFSVDPGVIPWSSTRGDPWLFCILCLRVSSNRNSSYGKEPMEVICADPLIAILDDPASDLADREHYQKDWLGVFSIPQ